MLFRKALEVGLAVDDARARAVNCVEGDCAGTVRPRMQRYVDVVRRPVVAGEAKAYAGAAVQSWSDGSAPFAIAVEWRRNPCASELSRWLTRSHRPRPHGEGGVLRQATAS